MKNTTHSVCRQLVALCVAHGVRRVVLSPGSRNAPLLVAFAREKAIEHHVVVDERVAGFVALGMATRSGEPVAVVCIGGLLYATLMTLFVVPCIYDMMNKKELRKISEEDLKELDM